MGPQKIFLQTVGVFGMLPDDGRIGGQARAPPILHAAHTLREGVHEATGACAPLKDGHGAQKVRFVVRGRFSGRLSMTATMVGSAAKHNLCLCTRLFILAYTVAFLMVSSIVCYMYIYLSNCVKKSVGLVVFLDCFNSRKPVVKETDCSCCLNFTKPSLSFIAE